MSSPVPDSLVTWKSTAELEGMSSMSLIAQPEGWPTARTAGFTFAAEPVVNLAFTGGVALDRARVTLPQGSIDQNQGL